MLGDDLISVVVRLSSASAFASAARISFAFAAIESTGKGLGAPWPMVSIFSSLMQRHWKSLIGAKGGYNSFS